MSQDIPRGTDAEGDLARRCGESMYANDHASQGLGIRIEAIGPGFARMSMRVRRDMLNGYGTCHGGFLFTLADSAFAFACNSRNDATVAAGCSIEFLRPGREGELLVATAQERVLSGRTGIYDAAVVNESGETIAVFRGRSARIKGEVIAGAHVPEA
ncbi:acyl-CoA thioesterase [Panacagrimonas perspica]|uniref:Acyl-CoA thioesterase n=1 Tax=Panacagrimonas perspica TaxID=381431 RepID=A0A4S3K2F4_9GAMM|nr:hydroxyphenylacetyl-CoA thioesterase PaaI [Panacagrimonas perspica]TDU28998.1 acyl-CoA thioesterase [Panacagrimonas perspica]THD02185.1 phenylacetic acid degradation protein PaaD [Panacagrimonas perspica]